MTEYTFFRQETGELEKVQYERWRWVAIYKDGGLLKQFDPITENFHQIKEIDQNRLVEFQMVNDEGVVHSVWIHGNRRFIHFYRMFRPAGTQKWYKLYCFGYQWKTFFGKNKKKINVILPDDTILTVSDMSELRLQ